MSVRVDRLITIVGLLVVSACGGGGATDVHTSPPKPTTPSFRVVSGAGATDTIARVMKVPLVISVDPARSRLSGVVVRVSGLAGSAPINYAQRTPFVAGASGTPTDTTFADTTDATGSVSFRIKLGSTAGPQQVIIEVPEFGLRDSASFTGAPGPVTHIGFASQDTNVFAGGPFAVGAAPRDFYQNACPGVLQYSARGTVTQVDASGQAVAGVPGTGYVVVRLGTMVDSARFIAVPKFEIAYFTIRSSPGSTFSHVYDLWLANLDGSNRRRIDTTASAFPHLTASADGKFILHHDERAGGRSLVRVGRDGKRIEAAVAPIRGEDGVFGSGDWIYYSYSAPGDSYAIWRAHGDGSGTQKLANTYSYFTPSASADGRWVTSGSYEGSGIVGLVDLTTGAVKNMAVVGDMPDFSPVQPEIAYVARDHNIWSVNADGSNVRLRSPNGRYSLGPRWSPDGKWLIVSTSAEFDLIDATTGARLLLPWTAHVAPNTQLQPGALVTAQ
ncbi:MAG: hypothetical protein ABJE47_08865 [bacterium]